MKIIIWFCRLFVGLLFIYSGFVKAVDPLGFSYKLSEYFEKFSEIFSENGLGLLSYPMEWMASISLLLSMAFVILEIVLGVLTILGVNMKSVSKWLLGLILFFTFLTFVSWAFRIVETCGCFGDAIPLSPFTSFMKDCVLTVLITVIFIFRNNINSLFNPIGDRLAIYSSTIVCALLTWYCYQHLPIKDYRAYAVGENLLPKMKGVKGNPMTMYKMKHLAKDSTIVAFSDYPFDYKSWKYIDNEEVDGELNVKYINIKSNNQKTKVLEIPDLFKDKWELLKDTVEVFVPDEDPKIQQLNAFDYEDDSKDYINEILNKDAFYFIVALRTMDDWGDYDVNNNRFYPSSKGEEVFKKLNSLAKKARIDKIKIHVLCSEGSYMKVEAFRHSLQTPYYFYACDDTELKTMIRSSPGLFLLKKDQVIAKWHYNDFPKFEEVKNEYIK